MRFVLPFFLLFFAALAQQPDALEPEELQAGETVHHAYNQRMRAFICYGENTVYVSGHSNVIIILGACKSVVVNGSHNRIRIDGPCQSLVLNGDRNGVDVQAADAVSLNGNLNHCRWRAGISEPKPKPKAHGRNNLLERYEKKANSAPWGFYAAPPTR